MEKKQSSIDKFVQQLKRKGLLITEDSEYIVAYLEAKAMHKEEIMDAIIESEKEHYSNAEVYPPEFVLRKAEYYYNETFGETKN